MQSIQKINLTKSKKWLVLGIFVSLCLPLITLSSSESKIYVDDDASGTQDGSSEHPFKTINQAIDEADKDTEIHVRNGKYQEDIDLKKGVELFGEDREKTILKGKDDDEPVIKMRHKTKIDKFTIKKGEDGILVDDGAKVSIIDCVIKDNKRHGINIEEGEVKKKKMVSISENEIRDNGKAGIYSETRKLSIVDNTIKDNYGDGIIVAANSSAWIADNKIKNNGKSGMKLTLDGSNIWTKHNKISDNDREGIEINFYGGYGRIDISKTDLKDNKRYGVARVQRFQNYPSNLWGGYLTFDDRNEFSGNVFGNISNVVVIK